MKCPICNQHDEFVFEEQARVWRCDRCHERFILTSHTNCDAKVEPINADEIERELNRDISEPEEDRK